MLDIPRDPEILMNWIVDHSIFLYQMAENRNDFFLLHGITASWALANIIPLLKSTEDKLDVLQKFLCILLAVVQICHEAALRNPESSDLCKRACCTVHDYFYHTRSFSESRKRPEAQ